MLTANKLEKIIELEETLRSEYQEKLDAGETALEKCQKELADARAQMQATIDKQLQTISELSKKSASSEKFEQQNRELFNRSENMKDDVTKQKQRIKSLQSDLAKEREELKVLKQFDPAKMKKNLDASKKKLAEKTSANEILQKNLNKNKSENLELQQKVKELESKLAELEPDDGEEKEAEAA
jgi:septal ring factor EnvC (AmiA/AmiB activator)